jgi:hypothetical protein
MPDGNSNPLDRGNLAWRLIKGKAPRTPGYTLDAITWDELPDWQTMRWSGPPAPGDVFVIEWRDYTVSDQSGNTGTVRVHIMGAQLFDLRPDVVGSVALSEELSLKRMAGAFSLGK